MSTIYETICQNQPSHLKFSGYLDKHSRFGLRWNKRYVDYDGELLRYFNDKDDEKPKAVYRVSKAEAFTTLGGRVAFSVVNDEGKKPLVFSCPNEVIREMWIKHLNQHSNAPLLNKPELSRQSKQYYATLSAPDFSTITLRKVPPRASIISELNPSAPENTPAPSELANHFRTYSLSFGSMDFGSRKSIQSSSSIFGSGSSGSDFTKSPMHNKGNSSFELKSPYHARSSSSIGNNFPGSTKFTWTRRATTVKLDENSNLQGEVTKLDENSNPNSNSFSQKGEEKNEKPNTTIKNDTEDLKPKKKRNGRTMSQVIDMDVFLGVKPVGADISPEVKVSDEELKSETELAVVDVLESIVAAVEVAI